MLLTDSLEVSYDHAMLFILPFFLFVSSIAWAQTGPNLCDLLDLKNCSGVSRQGRRSSLLSLPSPTPSTLMNPATVSFDRGFGVEAMFQAGNPVVLSAASGTGRMGGALISTSLENTFFGNRVIELNDDLLERNKIKRQYQTKKLGFALGGRLFNRKFFNLDLGVILKRHSEIKKINPGVGLSGRLGFLTFGVSHYKDDYFLDLVGHIDPLTGLPYQLIYGKDTFQDSFKVTTYSVGTKYKAFSLDAGIMKSSYDSSDLNSTIKLYSVSYIFRNFMFNFAYRDENSPAPLFVDDQLKIEERKKYYYGGVQASLGKHFIVGLNYNYFLLKEVSFSSTLFF